MNSRRLMIVPEDQTVTLYFRYPKGVGGGPAKYLWWLPMSALGHLADLPPSASNVRSYRGCGHDVRQSKVMQPIFTDEM
jgi:hypothetical protein